MSPAPTISDPHGHLDEAAAGRVLVEMLARIPDPRRARGVRHRIGSVLGVMVFAVLAGARNFREIADRAGELPEQLLTAAGCRRRDGRFVVPSEATIRRISHRIDADTADELVCRWLAAHARPAGRVGIAVDGKTIRNSGPNRPGQGGELALFSALLHHQAVVIAQRRVPEGTTETTQIQALLAGTDLGGVVVTADAAHAHHSTAEHLSRRGGDYVLTVKGNQPGLLARVAAALPLPVPGSEHHVHVDHGKGRIVRRGIWVAPADQIGFPAAAQVFRIRRDTFDHTGTRLSKQIVHGVTSLTATHATPAVIAGLVRDHWRIENTSHWVRDVVYREDHQHTYAGTGAHLLATLRNLAIGLLRLAGHTNITRTLQRNAADRTRILPLITTATTNRL